LLKGQFSGVSDTGPYGGGGAQGREGGWAASLCLPFPARLAEAGGGADRMPSSCHAEWPARNIDGAVRLSAQEPKQDH
jgi:hypothetical protein